MKSLRVWLLVLLTVLLPLRGAMAAAMLCPPAGTGVQTEVHIAGQAHDHGHSHADGTHDHHAQLSLESQHSDHHDFASAGDPTDKCNLCTAFCSVTGMVSGQATVAEPQRVATVFPHLYAPPPSFFPDGQERPPRTI